MSDIKQAKCALEDLQNSYATNINDRCEGCAFKYCNYEGGVIEGEYCEGNYTNCQRMDIALTGVLK